MYGVGILIDFKATPGAVTNSITKVQFDPDHDKGVLWEEKFNYDLAARCLLSIVEEIHRDPTLAAVTGIQVCDVPFRDQSQKHAWYNELLEELSSIEPFLPVYIEDGEDLESALIWSLGRNALKRQKPGCPVFISTNRLYTDDPAKYISANQLIASIKNELHEIGQHNSGGISDLGGATATFVNSFSCAMSPEIRSKINAHQRDETIKQFGRYQTLRWHGKASGCMFWTWNATRLKDKGFDFRTQVEIKSLYIPADLSLTKSQVRQKLTEADFRRSQLMTSAMERHIAYFKKVGGKYEHWRYADGWHLGFTDARAFFASRLESIPIQDKAMHNDPIVGADKIGALDMWVLKRMREENTVSRDRCEFVWEWEHGFRAGVRAFYQVVGTEA